MPRQKPLDAWTEQVVDAFPKLSRPQATVLALYSVAVHGSEFKVLTFRARCTADIISFHLTSP